MIADGTLKPGGPAPSAAALARETGYSTLTCRAALRALARDGTLTPGVSPGARLRVAHPGGGAHPDALQAELSRSLAARRRAAGLTQPELAAKAGVSHTTVGHAETGRLWQSREFWQQAGDVLGDGGDLLRFYDAYRAGGHAPPGEDDQQKEEPPAAGGPVLPVSVTITPGGVVAVWPDGTETTARPPGWRG
jgi:DNA-binding XRE family transcriptional regulator